MHGFLKFIFRMKLYMFLTVHLSIIRSFSLYTQQWYMSYRLADCLRAGSGWHMPLKYHLIFRRRNKLRGNVIVIIAQLCSYFEVQSRNSCCLVARWNISAATKTRMGRRWTRLFFKFNRTADSRNPNLHFRNTEWKILLFACKWLLTCKKEQPLTPKGLWLFATIDCVTRIAQKYVFYT
jgi:hypothetical protein